MKRLFILLLSLSFFFSTHANHIPTDSWDYIPDVSIKLSDDAASGVNLEIISSNFIFDPINASRENQIGHGHAHLYINTKKVARIYGNWFHISDSVLEQGMNVVRVSLNANGHEELTYKNLPIEDIVTIHYSGSRPGSGHDHHH